MSPRLTYLANLVCYDIVNGLVAPVDRNAADDTLAAVLVDEQVAELDHPADRTERPRPEVA
jgi:hypothetical protein